MPKPKLDNLETTPDAEQETAQFAAQQTATNDDVEKGAVKDPTIEIDDSGQKIVDKGIVKAVDDFEKEAGDGTEKIEGDEITTPAKETAEAEERGEKIPDGFINAALASGRFATEQEVIDFASDGKNKKADGSGESFSDEELLEMIPYLKPQAKEGPATKVEQPKEPTKVEQPPSSDLTGFLGEDEQLKALREEIRNELRTEFQEKLGNLENRLSQVQEDTITRENIRRLQLANEFFDRMNSEQIGKTDELSKFADGSLVPTDPRYKARSQIFDEAIFRFKNGKDSSFDKALKNASAWYKGLNMEQDIKRQTIRELKKNEKRLSPERYNVITEPVYESEEDRRVAVVKGLKERAGIKTD